jgi:hypothetical protein
MMGRTPTTMANDSRYLAKDPIQADQARSDAGQQLALLEATKAFSILEKTVIAVDSRSNAPFVPLTKLAHELQTATSNIPPELRQVTSTGVSRKGDAIRNAHVACTYYFSMMLLTRPFLVACTRQRCKRAATNPTARESDSAEPVPSTDMLHGALASIDSAIHTIQLVHDLLTADMLFNNMALVV